MPKLKRVSYFERDEIKFSKKIIKYTEGYFQNVLLMHSSLHTIYTNHTLDCHMNYGNEILPVINTAMKLL